MELTQGRENNPQEYSHAVSRPEPMPGSFNSARSGLLEDPLGALRGVLQRWRLLLVFLVIGSALGWVSAVVATDSAIAPVAVDHYEAEHVLVLDNTIPSNQTVLSVQNLNLLATRVTRGDVPDAVAESLGLSPEVASTQIRTVIRSDSDTIEIVAIAETPRQAEVLADEYAIQFLSFLESEAELFAEESLLSAELRLAEAEANLADVQAQLTAAAEAGDESSVAFLTQDQQQFVSARIHANAELLDVRSNGVPVVPIETIQDADGEATVISQARFDALVDRAAMGENITVLFGDEREEGEDSGALAAVSGNLPDGVLARVGFGALLGLLTGILLVGALRRLDNRVRSKRQVEQLLDLPVLAEVPSLERSQRAAGVVASHDEPRSRFAEQYRALASVLNYARRSRGNSGQVVLVTSPGPSEGKTTTVANLGAMLAESGHKVLLVNCDFRRPRLHDLTGTPYVSQAVGHTPIGGVSLIANVLSDSDAAPTEIITKQRSVIESARDRYDVVLIDTAPVLATNDAIDLLDLVDDVVLVVRAGKSTLQGADRAAEMLERRRAHVLGVAITDVNGRHSADYYYYDGYYEGDVDVRDGAADGTGKKPPAQSAAVDIDLDEESTAALSLSNE